MSINGCDIIKENQSLMRQIISIWSSLAQDQDISVKILTLLATVIGFACLAAFCIFVLVTIMGDPKGLSNTILIGTFVLLILFIVVGFIIALKSSKNAPIRHLDSSFELVKTHRQMQAKSQV